MISNYLSAIWNEYKLGRDPAAPTSTEKVPAYMEHIHFAENSFPKCRIFCNTISNLLKRIVHMNKHKKDDQAKRKLLQNWLQEHKRKFAVNSKSKNVLGSVANKKTEQSERSKKKQSENQQNIPRNKSKQSKKKKKKPQLDPRYPDYNDEEKSDLITIEASVKMYSL